MSNTKAKIQIQNNLKHIQFTDKAINKKLWLFKNSLYQIHVFQISNPYPHHKITSEHPINYFQVLQANNINYLIIASSTGSWTAYQITWESKSIQIRQHTYSALQNIDQRVIGIYLLQPQQQMILFVKINGELQYNYIGTNPKKQKNLKINKKYKTQTITKSQKHNKTNLFNKFKGKQLLNMQNESIIINSFYNQKTRQLNVVSQDINTKLCSIYLFFIQDYEVMSGIDFLLNLPSRPVQIIGHDKIVILNFGYNILLWTNNVTTNLQIPEDGYCTSLNRIAIQNYNACIINKSGSHLYRLLLTNPTNSKDQKLPNHKFQKLTSFKTNQLIINYTPFENNKIYPGFSINNKIQITQWEKDGISKTIFSNIQTKILQAAFFQYKFSSLLRITKQIGYSIQHKLITNSRIITDLDQYQHNMLIKMANIVNYQAKGDAAQIFLSSPIIGTVKFNISIQAQLQKKSIKTQSQAIQPVVNIKAGSSEPNIISQQQSLYLCPSTEQLTPTKIILQNKKYNISDLFQNKADFILAGCILGNYAFLAVEKQVHVFQIDSKPKRVHLHCFDTDIRNIYKLNDVNMWAALLWDGSLQILRIAQKESVKIKEISNIGADNSQNIFSFNIIINTAPHIFTIIGTHIIICSNDQLHVYQPQKTVLILYPIPQQIGNKFYPIIDLSSQIATKAQKLMILSNKDDRWMILQIPTKYLIKNNDQIKFQVQEIIAFPNVDNLIVSIIKDGVIVLFCGNKVIVCNLQTGGIVYKTDTVLPIPRNNSKNVVIQYLKNWVNQQQIRKQNLKIQSHTKQNLLQTHFNILKLSSTRVLLSNQKQIWYCSLSNLTICPISYFSMPNDAFIQFRNNLDINQLQNPQFMEIFADKLPIINVSKITQSLIAILYQKMIVIIQIKNNGALCILQQIQFSECQGLVSIVQFVGVYDQYSLYMKDISHRLILLKYQAKDNKYKLEIIQEIEDQIVGINRVNCWKQRTRKIDILGIENIKYQCLTIKKDGQLVVGQEERSIYL